MKVVTPGAFEIDDETGAPDLIYLEIEPLLAWNDAGEFRVGFEKPGSETLPSGYSIAPGSAPVVINPTAQDFEQETSSSITNANGETLSIDPETGVVSVD